MKREKNDKETNGREGFSVLNCSRLIVSVSNIKLSIVYVKEIQATIQLLLIASSYSLMKGLVGWTDHNYKN